MLACPLPTLLSSGPSSSRVRVSDGSKYCWHVAPGLCATLTLDVLRAMLHHILHQVFVDFMADREEQMASSLGYPERLAAISRFSFVHMLSFISAT
ncbi:uncharacterized protein LACBIDRAFT_306601 [Laccaria bicolor S238N-H82]|uniref:Predicted protein n=1 Tax=Laccaria bicolor (strain S238N-H82 / ATCC MYA-4686) TaxID=486041 RepID=B0DNE4_LACBS|nr:uncharacterized protein LACBIDRAFT_306601 [Laccaria bicolor S238N-H82]EDR03855.1 predicted protein [Laccaria bicolor S238N-H82]|eukprot:XP_001885423.1 predicted protein [Laccaria bicolor S238N-H82]